MQFLHYYPDASRQNPAWKVVGNGHVACVELIPDEKLNIYDPEYTTCVHTVLIKDKETFSWNSMPWVEVEQWIEENMAWKRNG